MATINLLPWREERREELKKEFITVLVACGLFAAAIIFVWQMVLNGNIEHQDNRNKFLQVRIDELQKQVEEINQLKQKKKQLVARLEVIQSLQGNRPQIVHIMDEITQSLPDGVFYNSIVRSGSLMTLKGTAESNNRVSSLMRRLDGSKWFANPNLRSVRSSSRLKVEGANDFEMTVNITAPQKEK